MTFKIETKLTHKGRKPDKHFGTVNPPIFATSTLVFPNMEAYEKAQQGETIYQPLFDSPNTEPSYGITGNQTQFALQDMIKDLEGAETVLILPTGLSAINLTLMALLKTGDHLLMVDSVYGPSRRFCNNVLKQFGIETTFYDPEIGAGIESLIQPNTKLIFMESPGSFTFEVQDVGAIVKVAKSKNILTAIDNSWASPLYYTPLKHGVDVSIHAITKYINGHSDLLMGSIACNEKTSKTITHAYRCHGNMSSAFDCYLALRGIRTMHARLEYQQRSLEKILAYLETVPQVSAILAPSYKKFKGYDLWKKQFTGATPLFSIVLDKKYEMPEVYKMCDYELFAPGASWGGYESLVRHLHIDTVRTATKGKHKNSAFRFYIGLENPDDLIQDLDAGFKRLANA